MKRLSTAFFLCVSFANCPAQTTPAKLSFAFPDHPGTMSLDQRNWKITELSAKENGTEFGIRAADGDYEFLGFLYPADKRNGAALTCRESMLKSERLDNSPDATDRATMTSDSGIEIATVLIYRRDHTKLSDHVAGADVTNAITHMGFRAFIGSGDLCADMNFDFPLTSPDAQKTVIESFQSELRTLQFDPHAKPTFLGAFTYATVDLTHFLPRGALAAYEIALDRAKSSDDPKKWTSITADQRSIALAMLQGPKQVPAACLEVIAHNPDYPGAYYILAKLDAEAADAEAAHTHLQQAFDRRANTLPGEIFPDPALDKSFLQLKENKDFWAFVQDLSSQLKRSKP